MKGGHNARRITYQGLTLTIPQWIDKLGLKTTANAIYHRIFILHWPMERVFIDKPKRAMTERVVNNGVEAWQELMICRGYFRKENKIKAYKMLNTWYKEFLMEDMKVA